MDNYSGNSSLHCFLYHVLLFFVSICLSVTLNHYLVTAGYKSLLPSHFLVSLLAVHSGGIKALSKLFRIRPYHLPQPTSFLFRDLSHFLAVSHFLIPTCAFPPPPPFPTATSPAPSSIPPSITALHLISSPSPLPCLPLLLLPRPHTHKFTP